MSSRRVYKIDIGKMSAEEATEYMHEMMQKYRGGKYKKETWWYKLLDTLGIAGGCGGFL